MSRTAIIIGVISGLLLGGIFSFGEPGRGDPYSIITYGVIIGAIAGYLWDFWFIVTKSLGGTFFVPIALALILLLVGFYMVFFHAPLQDALGKTFVFGFSAGLMGGSIAFFGLLYLEGPY
jgi:hypothetical protein